jgi:hypothetical protein
MTPDAAENPIRLRAVAAAAKFITKSRSERGERANWPLLSLLQKDADGILLVEKIRAAGGA